MLGGTYSTGTISVPNNSVTVTGIDVLWNDVLEGDELWPSGHGAMIIGADVVHPFTSITLLTPWPGTTLAGSTYVIVKTSWKRHDVTELQKLWRTLAAELEATGNFIFVEGDEPDPEMGENGQWALKTNVAPWSMWHKEFNVWVPQAVPVGGGDMIATNNLSEIPDDTVARQNIGAASDAFVQAGTGAVTRTMQDKARERISVKDFGAVGDDVANDTAAVQAAINYAQMTHAELIIPPGTFKITSPLLINNSLRIRGAGVEPYRTIAVGGAALRGTGSWFHFAHLGKGIHVYSNTVSLLSGVELIGFGTYRDQPALGTPGWAPIAADYDIVSSQADLTVNTVTLLNPTNGIAYEDGGVGRINISHLRGCPFHIGIHIGFGPDICRISDVHFWPFTGTDDAVFNYMRANLVALWLHRCDGPWVHNFMAYNAFIGIKISQNASGSVNLMNVSNVGIDGLGTGGTGILVDNSVVGGCTGRFSNIYITSSEAAYGINILGEYARLHFANTTITSGATTVGINVGGANNFLSFTGLGIVGVGNGVVVGADNTVDIAGNPGLIVSGTAFSGAGIINATDSQVVAQKALSNYFLGGGNTVMTGNNNTAVGRGSLVGNLTGSLNTAIGVQALAVAAGANFNVAIGVNALLDANDAAASANTVLGFNTGRGIVTGGNNTIVGANITGLAPGLSNSIILADGAGDIRLDYGKTAAATWTASGNIVLSPPASATPAVNGQLTFQATSNTSLTFKYKGTDGVVRSGNLTLA